MMRKTVVLLTAVALIVAATGTALPAVVGQSAQSPATNTTDATAGEKLSGVFVAQHEDTNGDIDRRAFAVKLQNAETPDDRARIIRERQQKLENQSKQIQARATQLNNKSVDGSYVAEAARLAQSSANLKSDSAMVVNETKKLPNETLERNGVNVTRLKTLRSNADSLAGPEVARTARGLAGNSPSDVGPPENAGPPEGAGAPDDAGPSDGTSVEDTNETDTEDEDDDEGNEQRGSPEDDRGPPA